MSCDIISDIIFMFYYVCKITVIININKFIYFSYIVSIISVNGIMFMNNNTVGNISMFSLHYVFHLSSGY